MNEVLSLTLHGVCSLVAGITLGVLIGRILTKEAR